MLRHQNFSRHIASSYSTTSSWPGRKSAKLRHTPVAVLKMDTKGVSVDLKAEASRVSGILMFIGREKVLGCVSNGLLLANVCHRGHEVVACQGAPTFEERVRDADFFP